MSADAASAERLLRREAALRQLEEPRYARQWSLAAPALSRPGGSLVEAHERPLQQFRGLASSQHENGETAPATPEETATKSTNNLPFIAPDVFIAVMGMTGTGKSTFINQVTGGELEVGHSLASCTHSIQAASTTINGRRVTLIVTPGFDDAEIQESQSPNACASHFHVRNPVEIDDAAEQLVLAVRPPQPRAYKSQKKMCGTKRYENITLATTTWDTVTKDIGEQREKEPKEKYWEHILSGGGNTYRHDSKETSAEKIMMKLLPYQSVVLDIQEEMLGDLLALSERIWLGIHKRWQELFGHHPGLSNRIRQTRSLSPQSLLALAIWFASPVLADEPASRSRAHDRQNILHFIKHTDLLSSYGIQFPLPDFIGTPSSLTFGSAFLIYFSAALVFHRFNKDHPYQNHFLVVGMFCGMVLTIATTNGAGLWGPFLVYVPSCVSIALAISAVLHRAVAKRHSQSSESPGEKVGSGFVDVAHGSTGRNNEKVLGQ